MCGSALYSAGDREQLEVAQVDVGCHVVDTLLLVVIMESDYGEVSW